MQSRLIRLIRVVFANSTGTMLSVSDKYDSVYECTQEIGSLSRSGSIIKVIRSMSTPPPLQ